MGRHYSAFLVRHWLLDDEESRRIEVAHIASGTSARVTSLEAALAWIDDRSRTLSPARADRPPAPAPTHDERREAGIDRGPW